MQRAKLIIIFLFLASLGRAQDLRGYLDKGDRLLNRKDYDNALTNYLEAYQSFPEDASVNFRVGLTYLYLPSKSKALPFLEKAYDVKPNVDEDIDYHLGMAYKYSYKFPQAQKHFESFQRKNKKLADIAEQKIFECKISDSLSQRPLNVEVINLGSQINSKVHEYAPLVSADGSTLIFTSNRPLDENDKRGPESSFEDIYICKSNSGSWGTPQLISPNINIKFNDAAASLSGDGKTIFIYYEQGGGDLYTSEFNGSEWSEPKPLNKNINSPFWETSACLSPDGEKLYFTSSRPGGYGQLDIYVSEKDDKGEWGKAKNLGKTINTPGNDDSPFLHADGVTLYFSSDGHPTMGSNDIFQSKWENNEWQKPLNLGYPINSIEYDGFFSLSPDKKVGYYSTIREDGHGDADLYTIHFLENPDVLQEEAKKINEPEPPAEEKPIDPIPVVVKEDEEEFMAPIVQLHRDLKIVTVLKGKVIDATTAVPLDAIISLTDNTTNEIIARVRSNHETGDFELSIPHGGNYGVSTERIGYLFNSINFNLPQFAEYQEIDTHIIMVKAEVGSKAVLKNIFFDTGDAKLKNESLSELSNIIELLEDNPNLNVQINGHTDNTGDHETNKALSFKRATSVVNYLVEKGISSDRLSAVGYGEERPLVSNDDEADGREINRRTEIEIIQINP